MATSIRIHYFVRIPEQCIVTLVQVMIKRPITLTYDVYYFDEITHALSAHAIGTPVQLFSNNFFY